MNPPPWTQVAVGNLTTFGLKLLGAIAVWIIGRRLIALAVRMVMAAVRRQSIDETLVTYIGSALTILLDVVLVVALLGFFGVETTSFAALLAGMEIAIGTAWGGILSNLATLPAAATTYTDLTPAAGINCYALLPQGTTPQAESDALCAVPGFHSATGSVVRPCPGRAQWPIDRDSCVPRC